MASLLRTPIVGVHGRCVPSASASLRGVAPGLATAAVPSLRISTVAPFRAAKQPSRPPGARLAATAAYDSAKKQKAKKGRAPSRKNPNPGMYQHTLKQSFVRAGEGLHSGEIAFVRVMPAFAGEGRYFVRVPDGHISNAPRNPASQQAPIDDTSSKVSYFGRRSSMMSEEEIREMEAKKYEIFTKFLGGEREEEQEEGDEEGEEVVDVDDEEAGAGDEAPLGIQEGEVPIYASLESLRGEQLLSTRLGEGPNIVMTCEHLLSALEGCGVDNARIEIEGGPEVPIIDGSSNQWCTGIVEAGVASAKGPNKRQQRRMAWQPDEVIHLQEGDAFITLFPAERTRLTYGIDFKEKAPCIGRSWLTWVPMEDEHYIGEVSKARTFCCREDIEAMEEAGLIKGGSPSNALIADGVRFYNPPVRYFDEPVRHKLLDLVGDLSLLGEGGNAGLPHGHIVAFKAGHAMHTRFAQMVLEACDKQEHLVPAEFQSAADSKKKDK